MFSNSTFPFKRNGKYKNKKYPSSNHPSSFEINPFKPKLTRVGLDFLEIFLSKISTRKFDFLSYESYKISRIVSQFVYRYLFIKFLQVFSSRIQKLLRHHSSTIISYPVLTFPFHQISKTLVLLFTSFRLNIPREQIQMD
uniref:Uncharacterized protein n=1 Tax=Cacopsylla melanoneura TaxID=428564 RepID=A0A8D9BFG8_9HEMI